MELGGTVHYENTLLLTGTIIPLLTGLTIYLTSGNNTYVSAFASGLGINLISVNYPEIIRNYACDFLWGYALYSGLRLFDEKSNPHAKSALIALTAVTILELTQLSPKFPGTFDCFDILVETAAVITAMFITTLPGRFIHEKEN